MKGGTNVKLGTFPRVLNLYLNSVSSNIISNSSKQNSPMSKKKNSIVMGRMKHISVERLFRCRWPQFRRVKWSGLQSGIQSRASMWRQLNIVFGYRVIKIVSEGLIFQTQTCNYAASPQDISSLKKEDISNISFDFFRNGLRWLSS